MDFKKFRDELITHFNEMIKDEPPLFMVNLNKDELWNLYQDSFAKEDNKIFRMRRQYDCSTCRHFIKMVGNVVTIKDNKLISIWDFEPSDDKYKPVVKALSDFVKSEPISDVFISPERKIGNDFNYENTDGRITQNSILKWNHFYLELPDKYVETDSHRRVLKIAQRRDVRNVFWGSLDKITQKAVKIVLELISQNSLYKGEEWKAILEKFLEYDKEYDLTPYEEKNNFVWIKSIEAGEVVGKIKNHSIGVLLTNISEGMELDEAVRKYEFIVAPSNYKRPKPVYTQKMLDDAKKTIEEMGLTNSLKRRFANIDDISINNVLFSNKDAVKKDVTESEEDIFSKLEKGAKINPKIFSRVEEISIEDFIENVLPTTKELEVLFEGKHMKNLVSLIAPEVKDSKNMFKWNNNFGWAYKGNVTDSLMKERVKAAGGKVDGVLRFSIQWNDNDYNPNDFDAHCVTPDRREIFYARDFDYVTGGKLDVDIMCPNRGVPAVENITWASREQMTSGEYLFFVHCYTHRGGTSGFSAEIEFDGQIYSFEYYKPLRENEIVEVARVTAFPDGSFTIKELLPSLLGSKEEWNITTNQFIPVSLVCYSPNYWDEQNGIGNKHYFFMLKDCINPETPNGIYNEFLNNDLNVHRKVLEALGAATKVKDTDNQLSGLGFSSTLRNELVVKVKGATERVLKIKF